MATLRELQMGRGINPELDTAAANERWLRLAEENRNAITSDRTARDEAFTMKYGSPLLHPEINASVDMGPGKPSIGRTIHATNIGSRAAEWEKEGKKPIMVAETPGAEEEAKKAGVKDVRKSVDYKEPRKPSEDDIVSAEMTKGMWGKWLESNGYEEDPLKINSAMKGVEAGKAYDAQYPKPRVGTAEFKQWEKDRAGIVKEKVDEARADRDYAKDYFKEIVKFTRDKDKIEEAKLAKVEKAKAAQEARVKEAAKATRIVMDNYENWDLPSDVLNKIGNKKKGERVVLEPGRYKLKPERLRDLNRIRAAAGMPPLEENDITVDREEFLQIFGQELPWPFTYGTKGKSTEYAEGKSAAPAPSGGGGASSQLAGKPAGRYRVDGQIISWDGTKEIR